MINMFVSKPLDTSGIVNSPSRDTISSEPITSPITMLIRISEMIRSKAFRDGLK